MPVTYTMKRLKIADKLTIYFFLVGLSIVIFVSIIFYNGFKSAILSRTHQQLSSVNVLKKAHVESYFDKISQHTFHEKYFSKTSLPDSSQHLQHPKKGDRLLSNIKHYFEHKKNNSGEYLLDSSFNVIYGKSSHPATVQQQEKHLRKKGNALGDTLFLDLSTDNHRFIVLHIPLPSSSGMHYLWMEVNTERLDNIMYERTGLGSTGESYIVGKNQRMRTPSRFLKDTNPLSIDVKTTAVENVFQNKGENERIIKDYRGHDVLSAYSRIDVNGLEWAIVSEIDVAEAMVSVRDIRAIIVLFSIVLTAVIAFVTNIIAHSISKPIVDLSKKITILSKGQLPEPNALTQNEDEIGDIDRATTQLIHGFQRTSAFAEAIGQNKFDTTYEPLSDKDVLGNALINMRRRLKEAHEHEIRLQKQRTAGLIEGQENERKRISQELHDGIGQLLTAIRFMLSSIEGNEETKKEIKKIIDDTITEVRRISNNLMPNVLLDFGLVPALKLLAKNTTKMTSTEVDLHIDKTLEDASFPKDVKTSIYRIAQEGINNAIKYANADTITLTLEQVDAESIIFSVEDDGDGFDIEKQASDEKKASNGLRNMKERVKLIQGIMEIHTAPGEGTRIHVIFPYTDEEVNTVK